jgi:hypothetical protein
MEINTIAKDIPGGRRFSGLNRVSSPNLAERLGGVAGGHSEFREIMQYEAAGVTLFL